MNNAKLSEEKSNEERPMPSIERALDVALIVMENGGSTPMAERAFRNALQGSKQDAVSTAWRLDLVTVSGVAEGRPFRVLRPVGPIGSNLFRASEAAVLAERIAEGKIETADLISEIRRVKGIGIPYNRWVMMAAAAFTAAFTSQLLGREWGALGIAFVAAAAGQFVRSLLQARRLAVAPVTLICGMISACLADIGLRLGFSQAVPTTLIASVIYMVPGLPLINGFVDAVSHKHLLVGLERVANAAYLFFVLAVAVAFAYIFI